MKLEKILKQQMKWSIKTFGRGLRTEATLKHIEKEISEVRNEPTDLSEWVDIILLGFEGALRVCANPQKVAEAVMEKMKLNQSRDYPSTDQDTPSFHIKDSPDQLSLDFTDQPLS